MAKIIVNCLCAFLLFSLPGVYGKENKDDRVYDDLATIRGHVQIIEHPTLGSTPGRGLWLIFQRMDCGKCIIATLTDDEGNYDILIGKGNYRVIMRDVKGGGAPSFDMLAPDQARSVEAVSVTTEARFDIKVVVNTRKVILKEEKEFRTDQMGEQLLSSR